MKPKKQKSAEPSLRDKLSQNFLRAFETDFDTHGVEVIKQLRQKSPEKYAEIAAKLIAAIEPRGEGFDSCRTKEELGRALLESVGFNDPDDDSIQQAIQLHDKFIDNLQHVHQCALASEEEMH